MVLFSTHLPLTGDFKRIFLAAGAIVVEWNIGQSSQGSAGMWDTHIRFVDSAENLSNNR